LKDKAWAVTVLFDVFESGEKINLQLTCFLPVDGHHTFYGFSNVERRNVFPEFLSFNLGKVKQILDHIYHQL